jgi:predicted RNA polymerase sigma factor
LNRRDESLAAYRDAVECVGSEPERRFLERRIRELT